MAYVVTEPCINCKYTDCVEVCPVDCFYEGLIFLVIEPAECINCNACVPVCPVQTIYPADQVLKKWSHYEQWNERLSEQWSDLGYNITEKNGPLGEADQWKEKEKTEKDISRWDE